MQFLLPFSMIFVTFSTLLCPATATVGTIGGSSTDVSIVISPSTPREVSRSA